MAFDLGTLAGGVLGEVIDYQRQRFAPSQPAYDSPWIPNFLETNLPAPGAQSGVASMSCGGNSPKRVLGYLSPDGTFCQKKSRRRRNRLATTSDIKDLASLKAVLGGGKAFETWIATH